MKYIHVCHIFRFPLNFCSLLSHCCTGCEKLISSCHSIAEILLELALNTNQSIIIVMEIQDATSSVKSISLFCVGAKKGIKFSDG